MSDCYQKLIMVVDYIAFIGLLYNLMTICDNDEQTRRQQFKLVANPVAESN